MIFGALYRAKGLLSYVHPTYGNTMYHTGMIRLIAENGFMPIYDLSYGGFTKSFYVPIYRLFVSSLSIISNIDPMIVSALAVVAFGLVTIAVAYLLGKEIGGVGVGLAAALLFVLSPELTIYTIRPFPQVLGIPFLLLTLYFLKKENRWMTVLSAVLTVMSHQTTAVVLGSFLLVYAVVKKDKNSALALITAIIAYFIWQMFALGSFDIMSMRQIALKESGQVYDWHIMRIGSFALLFAPFGLVKILKDYKKHLLLLIFAGATLILTKNELLGINIFTDRLFTFFALAVIFVAAVGIGLIAKALEGAKWK